MTADKLGDWHIVSRETHDRSGPLINFFLRLLFLVPEAPEPSSVTWTVRHDRTGEVHKITADSEGEFAERLAALTARQAGDREHGSK